MSSSVPFSSEPPSKEDELKRLLALETAGRYIGPMPVDDFLNEFLPQGLDSCPTVPPDAFATVHGASPEIAMYPQFIESIGQFAPGMEFVDSHNHACNVGDFSLKPDVSVYAEGSRAAKVTTDFGTMETWLEFKTNTNDDPFVDYDIDNLPECSAERDGYLATFEFENDTVLAQQVRGQLTAYALAHLGSQFRNFGFSVLIMGKHARLMRWERAGAVVSRRFDYSKDPRVLVEFFWRFSHLTPAQRGIDTSVNPASSLSSTEGKHIREGLRLKPETPLFEYQVPDGDGSRSYFGPRPPCPSLSLIGRSTRALPVYDLENEKCVYLKAPFECGGDIGYRTITQTLVTEDWSCARDPITGHIHYRMVLGVVGRKLSTFGSTKELVQAMLDALTAHWKAYDDGKILHRDISSGNIILTDDGRGLLIDWDLSKSLEELKRRRRHRTGTWQFMSAALLKDPEKRHELQDDLESFLHVLAWSTVRYVPNKLTPDDRRDYLSMFDENKYSNGQTLGGQTKAFLLRGNDYVGDFRLEHFTPLVHLLKSLSAVFVARYGNPPSQDERDVYDILERIDENQKRSRLAVDRHIYEERLRRLTTSEWFISTFQRFLDSAGWPDNDGSVLNRVSSSEGIMTRRQEKLIKSHMENRDSRHEAAYYPSQSSHSSKRARSPSLAATEGRGKRPRGNTSTS